MPKIGGHLAAKVVRHKTYGTPRNAYDIKTPSRKGTPRAAAQAFLKGIAKAIRIGADLKDLRFDKVIESPLGSHVLFQQTYVGRNVSGAWVKVDLDPENRVYHFENSCVPVDFLAKTKKAGAKAPLTEVAALRKAMEAVGATKTRIRGEACGEQVNFPVGTTVVPAWKFLIPVKEPPHDWRIYISAQDGSVLHREDMLKMVSAKGLVFDPNPIATLDDTTLRESKPIPNTAYREVDLPDVASTGFLDGPYVSTKTTKKRVCAKSGKFLFRRNDRAFKEVMVYFHIDRMQRYVQRLGFDNVNRRQIAVNIAGPNKEDSHYSPVDKSLVFGTGGVDNAEDAEIILHEYGHAIQDAQVPGFGGSVEADAMSEGFGDYLAGSFFADAKPARLRNCIGSWDATAYSLEDPPCLRRLDSTKRYPRDLVKEEHADGEIWSACLWQIRELLGGERADKLVLSHHFLIRRDSSFEDAANALILADRQLNGGANEAAIRDIFTRRGILKSPKGKKSG